MNNIPFYGRLIIGLVVVMALAEFAPEPTNYILVLILVGIFLSRWGTFSKLFSTAASAAKK